MRHRVREEAALRQLDTLAAVEHRQQKAKERQALREQQADVSNVLDRIIAKVGRAQISRCPVSPTAHWHAAGRHVCALSSAPHRVSQVERGEERRLAKCEDDCCWRCPAGCRSGSLPRVPAPCARLAWRRKCVPLHRSNEAWERAARSHSKWAGPGPCQPTLSATPHTPS